MCVLLFANKRLLHVHCVVKNINMRYAEAQMSNIRVGCAEGVKKKEDKEVVLHGRDCTNVAFVGELMV